MPLVGVKIFDVRVPGRHCWPCGAVLVECYRYERDCYSAATSADVAQLVEHHLAKVRVAGSNPVVRSKETPGQRLSPEGLSLFPRHESTSGELAARLGWPRDCHHVAY